MVITINFNLHQNYITAISNLTLITVKIQCLLNYRNAPVKWDQLFSLR